MVLENDLIEDERVTVHRLSATWRPAAESMVTAETALWEQRSMDEVGCARKIKEGTTISRGSAQTNFWQLLYVWHYVGTLSGGSAMKTIRYVAIL